MKIIRRVGWCWGVLIGIAVCPGQSPAVFPEISFYQASYSHQVDYWSYPGIMVLAHHYSSFYPLPKNPVFQPSPSNWDAQDVADPFFLVDFSGVFMYYDGSSGNAYHLGLARLDSSGWFWQRAPDSLAVDAPLNWDDRHQVGPAVLRHQGQYWMFYSGNASDSELGYQIGRAVSRDGRNWQVDPPEPVIRLGQAGWDFAGVAYPWVVYLPEKKIFYMYYTGFQGPLAAIGLATSRDGIYWQPWATQPIFSKPPGVIAPCVIFNGNGFTMYFVQLENVARMATAIYRATSVDGVHWQDVQLVLRPRARWEGHRLMRPAVTFFDQRVHLFYCAQKGSRWQIGEAVAQPVFQKKGVWESTWVSPNWTHLEFWYDCPPQAGLRIRLIWPDQTSGESFELPRGFRRRWRVAIPATRRGHPWKLQLQFFSPSGKCTPVLYRIRGVMGLWNSPSGRSD